MPNQSRILPLTMEQRLTKPSYFRWLLREFGTWSKRRAISNPLWHYRVSIGLRRDLSLDVTPPRASIPLHVREIRASDVPLLLPTRCAHLPRAERREVTNRRSLISQNIQQCFVAIDASTQRPCFIQWALRSSSNEFIQRFFKGRFPALRSNQVLLENAYTPPDYRGRGIMADAMNRIALILKQDSIDELITFVDHENYSSIKGCARAGFSAYTVRHDYCVLQVWRRRVFDSVSSHIKSDSFIVKTFSPEVSS